MFHFFKTLVENVANAKPNKLRLFADENELFKTKNSLGVVRTLGNAVRSIEYQSTDGLVDTYLVKTDDFEFELPVTNGRGIESIEPPVGAGQPGTLDEYTIVFNDGTHGMLLVRNGTNGKDGTGVPTLVVAQPIGDQNTAGTAGPEYANIDHKHAHGEQTNPAHHAVATPAANGFMSKEDKAKTDGIAEGATRVLVDNLPTDGSNNAVSSNGVFDALALKLNAAEKGAANGLTPLGADQKVPAIFLPAFVDDVLEFSGLAEFPATGETGKIYTALNAGTPADPSRIYRWSGSTYVEISPSPGSTDAVPEGATNLYFTAQRVRETVLTGLSLVASTAITAADTVLSALGKLQKQITDGAAALAAHISNANNPHNTTAIQVGLGNVRNPVAPNVHTTAAQALNQTLTAVATMTIPGNALQAGDAFEFDVLLASLVNTTAVSNLEVAVFVNGVQNSIALAALGATAVAAPGRGGRALFKLVFRAVGATGRALANGTVHVNNLANFSSNQVAEQTVNTTVPVTIDVRVRTSAATSTGTVQFAAIDQST